MYYIDFQRASSLDVSIVTLTRWEQEMLGMYGILYTMTKVKTKNNTFDPEAEAGGSTPTTKSRVLLF